MQQKQRLIGYVRVSRSKQSTDLQFDAMKQAGVSKVYSDKKSGKNWQRQGLDDALAAVRCGDRLCVYAVDRLGRSLVPVVLTIEALDAKGAGLRSLSEGCDTSTEHGMMHALFLAFVAHLEHSTIRKRTQAGVDAARRRGKRRGAKPRLTKAQVQTARKMLLDGRVTAAIVAQRFSVGRATLFRHLAAVSAAP